MVLVIVSIRKGSVLGVIRVVHDIVDKLKLVTRDIDSDSGL